MYYLPESKRYAEARAVATDTPAREYCDNVVLYHTISFSLDYLDCSISCQDSDA